MEEVLMHNDDEIFEVLSAGEMRKKYGLTAENRPTIQLNPANVPGPLRHLIPLAEQFGISDDLIREDFVEKTCPAELGELRRVVEQHADMLDEWLAGCAADGPTFSQEYIAFTCMRMAADGC
jgi:hypothetical protein